MARLVQKILALILTFWVSSAVAEVRISNEGMDNSAPIVNLTERTIKAAHAVNAVATGMSDIEQLARDVQSYFGPVVDAMGGGGPIRMQQSALSDWMLSQLPLGDIADESLAMRSMGPVPLKVNLPPINTAPIGGVDTQALPAIGSVVDSVAGPLIGNTLDGVQDIGAGVLDGAVGGATGGVGGALPPVPLLGAN